jgi:hypothetical protein
MNAFSLTRRTLLAGLAAASAAATLPASAMAAAALESPALVALADGLAAALEEVKAARADYAQCVRDWSPLWPAVPEAIRLSYTPAHEGDWDFEGFALEQGERRRPVGCLTADGLAKDIATIRKAMNRKRPNTGAAFKVWTSASGLEGHTVNGWAVVADQLSGLKEIAMQFEAEKVRIHAAANFVARRDRRANALASLASAIGAVMAETPITVEGLLIQAQAMEAVPYMDPWQRASTALTASWGADFAASLIRISTAA